MYLTTTANMGRMFKRRGLFYKCLSFFYEGEGSGGQEIRIIFTT